jgi:pimeloyl-ACP methyl ester carboxylesterase
VTLSLTEGTGSSWGTEFSLPANSTTLTPQADDVYLSVRVDFSALVAGDAYVVKLYEKVNAGSSTALAEWPVVGVQVEQLQLPTLIVGGGWDVTVTRTAGSDRSIRWTLEKETASLTLTDDAATIGTTEYSLPGDTATPTPQATDCYVQPWISFAAMTAGDRFRVRVYERMNSGTSRVIVDRSFDGPQTKLWTCPVLLVGGGWDVTVTKVSGTNRSIAWSLRTDDRSGVASAPEYPQLQYATTAEAIRDRIAALMTAIVPDVLTGDRFREHRNQREADFFKAWEAAPAGALRRFQVRDTGEWGTPEVSNTDHDEKRVTFRIAVAYPQTGRYGADQALDRDDVMRSDQKQIEQAVGLYGRGNFTSPNPDACWRADGYSVERVVGDACDYLVITQTMSYFEQLL